MAALIIQDLNGGNYCLSFVDDELFAQIKAIPHPATSKIEGYDLYIYKDVIDWLSSSDPEYELIAEPAKFAPKSRNGKVLKTVYCQNFVFEKLNFSKTIQSILII